MHEKHQNVVKKINYEFSAYKIFLFWEGYYVIPNKSANLLQLSRISRFVESKVLKFYKSS